MMSDTTLACPECNVAAVAKRQHSTMGRPCKDGKQYRCKQCTATFDEPVERETYLASQPGHRSLLHDADQREAVLEALEREVSG
jgi:DNA-directed RNA polymerase subunit RPC12/RpoP